MPEKKLIGKVAVITGGARGLGRGYALRLAGLGTDIAIVDRNLKAADVYEFEKMQMSASTVVDECKALGVQAIGLEADLTDRMGTEKAIGDIVEKMGKIDIVVCNAGGGTVKFADELGTGSAVQDITTTGTPADCPQETLTRVLEINLMTCMYTCMAVAPYMKKQHSGKIVTVSSTAGIAAAGRYHPYGTANMMIALAGLAGLLFGSALADSDAVVTIEVDGEVNAAMTAYISDALDDAEAAGRPVVLVLDTYGGQILEADKIKERLMSATVPVDCYITRNALSAGTLFAISCERILMAEPAVIGAAETIPNDDEDAVHLGGHTQIRRGSTRPRHAGGAGAGRCGHQH